jgi:hypothetical protein
MQTACCVSAVAEVGETAPERGSKIGAKIGSSTASEDSLKLDEMRRRRDQTKTGPHSK